jgi:hypothetical protein
MSSTRKAIEGDDFATRKATEDDVEGHGFSTRKAVEGDDFATRKAVEGDDFATRKATEDDVEGHNIGVMNPMLARDLARARERDVQREASRNSLIGEAKRALGRKR